MTKPALKTHVIFEAIRSVFERDVELLSSGETRKEKVRKLIAKIVNVLGVKMEIGSPFICSYLLGIPDHYTNKKFVVCFWQNYVSYKVLIRKHKGSLIGVSVVEDYAYRPDELTCLSLYEWICLCTRKKTARKKCSAKSSQKNISDLCLDEEEFEWDDLSVSKSLDDFIVDDMADGPSAFLDNVNDNITDSLAEDFSNAFKELGNIIEAFQPKKPDPESLKGNYPFQKEHPLSSTHHVVCRGLLKAYVPNFVGSVLPRYDHGDYEYYCCTMLTLFQPWRSGLELKLADENWSSAFARYPFDQHQHSIMENFNLHYECLDA
ncbi:hypothetical protein ARMSODRAFT_899719 [Armillaria solidipes]|uniref:Uncharacterized protein n=1 Tax=Armillaria solidipes TaxID=1076256 RepID=A0A2H3B7Y0_9AGAR|nr:hypothetical protein ARMSODRAFT_899719 [Armillaria solidipes]